MLLSTLLFGAAATGGNVSRLVVQGDGKTSAIPDMVVIVIGVETRNVSAAIAAADNARLMNQTIQSLLKAGVNLNNIQTSRYTLTTAPSEEPKALESPGLPEFIATNMATAKLNITENLGRILDTTISSGSNNIQQVSFDLRNPQKEKDKALSLAIEDARHKAQVAAKTADVKLGRILEITEGYGYLAPATKSAIYLDASTPIQPGEIEVTSSVSMTYEIT